MHKLLPLVLICALLCGCGRSDPSEETLPAVPTESVAGEITTPEEYGGAVTTIPLNLSAVRGIRVFNGNVLLLSGEEATTLTLLDCQEGETRFSTALDFLLEPEDPSLVIHPEGTLSFFSPSGQETLVLDRNLTPVRHIPAPSALSGHPILSPDGQTLYYCTASHVRAFDVEWGIDRCVKEMATDVRQLTGVHRGGTVLQCRTGTEDRVQTVFLLAEDGSQLHQSQGSFTVVTDEDRFYAQIPAGANRAALFGSDPDSPRIFVPSDFRHRVFFLPEQDAALTLSEGFRNVLEYRRLSKGNAVSRLSLEPGDRFLAAACLNRDSLVLLSHRTETDRYLLTLWDPLSSPPEQPNSTIVSYSSAGQTDFSRCRELASRLEQQYGITVLMGEDAAQAAPAHCSFTPEYLEPILYWELTLLEQRLARYPTGILPDTAAHFSRLNLCLVRDISYGPGYPTAAPGLHYLAGNEAYLVLPTGPDGERALHHQLFHLMEIHILGESNGFDRWNELNPAGFRYDYDYVANENRDSGVYLFAENRVFADTFSMSYPKEDRARIMEYAMMPDQAQLFQPSAMQDKLRTLCKGIRDAYGLRSSPETFLWEQYLE